MYPFHEIQLLGERLIAKGETVAVAESVTSGHLQAALSLAENARQFYQGGISAYNLGQKARHLLVEPTHALANDCVSEQVAKQMAVAAARLFTSHYGLAITGYAATVPEKGINHLFAFFSIAYGNEVIVSTRIKPPSTEQLRSPKEFAGVFWSPGKSFPSMDTLLVQRWFTREVIRAFLSVV